MLTFSRWSRHKQGLPLLFYRRRGILPVVCLGESSNDRIHGSAARHAGPSDSKDACARAHARLGARATDPAGVARDAANPPGVALSGALPAGAQRTDSGGVGRIRQQSPREILFADEKGASTTRKGTGGLGAAVVGGGADSAAGVTARIETSGIRDERKRWSAPRAGPGALC